MALQSQACSTFLRALLEPFAGDVFMIALYQDDTAIGPETLAYTPDGEIPDGDGYAAGGRMLANQRLLSADRVVLMDWDDPVWTGTLAAAAALIYNASRDNLAVGVLRFGRTVRSTNDTFTVELPAPLPETAILRVSA